MQGLVKFFNVERGFGFVHNEAAEDFEPRRERWSKIMSEKS
jgi:hypothetical protein